MEDTRIRSKAGQLLSRCHELAAISDVPGEITRTFLSPATRRAQALLTSWFEAAGLATTIDTIGNLHGLSSNSEGKRRLIVGSHIDTVVNAGAFDGVLGVLLGVALVELVKPETLPFAIEVIAFSEEEGVRFGTPFLGSLALVGESVPDTVTDEHGISLAQALAKYGHDPTPYSLTSAFAYLEFHIEQGPLLEAEQRPLAAVSAIAGQTRSALVFRGQANHAGATPMRLRHDALAAAAEWIVAVEDHALATAGLVATVGSLDVNPGLGNVIASEVVATLDLRHADDPQRLTARAELIRAAERAATRRGVLSIVKHVLEQPAVAMDASLTRALITAAESCGYDAAPLVSGAGHDAMIVARRLPSAMLFLRTPAGLSHHPDESVLPEDVEAALATGVAFLNSLNAGENPHA